MAGKNGYGASDAAQGAVALAKAAGKAAVGNYVGAAKDAILNADKILPIIIVSIAIPFLLIVGAIMSLQSLFFGWLGESKMTDAEQAAAERAWAISQYQTMEDDLFGSNGVFVLNEKTVADKTIKRLNIDIPNFEEYMESGYKQMVLHTEDVNHVYPTVEDDNPLCVLVNETNNPVLDYEATPYGQLYQNSLYILNKTKQSFIVRYDYEQYIKSGYGPIFFSQLYQIKMEKEAERAQKEAEQALKAERVNACTSTNKPCGKCDGCLKFSESHKWATEKAGWCMNSDATGEPCNDCSWCEKFSSQYDNLRQACEVLRNIRISERRNNTADEHPCMKCEGCQKYLADHNQLKMTDKQTETREEEKAKEKTKAFLVFMKENCTELLEYKISSRKINNFKVDANLGFGDNLTFDVTILTVDIQIVGKEKLADIFNITEKKEDYGNNAVASHKATIESVDSGFEAQDNILELLQSAGYAKSNLFWQFSQRTYKRMFEKFTDFSNRNLMPVMNGEIIYYELDVDSPWYQTVNIAGAPGENVTLFADSTIFRVDEQSNLIVFKDANADTLYQYSHMDISQEFIDKYNAEQKGGEKVKFKANSVIGKVPEKTETEKQQDSEEGKESKTYITFGIEKYSILLRTYESVDPRGYIKESINITLTSTGFCWPSPGNMLVAKNASFGGSTPFNGILIANEVASLTDGKPVVAASSGKVAEVSSNSILIWHTNGTSTFYKNVSDIKVQQGQNVALGQLLGHVSKGSGGVYFEIRHNNEREGKSVIAQESGTVSYIEKTEFKDVTTGKTYQQKEIFVTRTDGIRVNYYNCNTVVVKKGDKITKNQVLGTYGKSEYFYSYPLSYYPKDEIAWLEKTS